MLRTLALVAVLAAVAGAQAPSDFIRVDQFGYRPLDRKVAILRDPQVGYDANGSFSPSAIVEVRRADNSLAWSGPPVAWNGGATHGQSGDRVWWLDFTALQETGSFRIVDPASGESSESFEIGENVYAAVLRDAVRMFLHQRCGESRTSPHVEPAWHDAACHLGAEQDLDCRSVLNPAAATTRDLSGGWHDAGDYNKYVNFTDDAIHGLLGAYEIAPAAWPDSWDLPESGNGVPDLLDEIRVGVLWMLKMQEADGSVLHKVSVTDFSGASPPSTDAGPRRYAPATASATISACGVFARAAEAFSRFPGDAGLVAQLDQAALDAWNWLAANPAAVPSFYNNSGFVNVAAEDSPYWQDMNRVRAAVWLFRRTNDPQFKNYVEANYAQSHLIQWFWASIYEHSLNEALLLYARDPACSTTVAQDITQTFRGSVAGYHLGPAQNQTDAYRAWLSDGDYTWGNNRTKSDFGRILLTESLFGLDAASARAREDAAAGYLHYLHGVNPTGYCYLTNMDAAGAEGSVQETYHAWFADGGPWDNASTSAFGPPPGFLVGGANPSYVPDAAYTGPVLTPPQNQPAQKSYLDWNVSWPENSWQVTECQLAYQSSYIRLLAHRALLPPARLGLEVPTLQSGTSVIVEIAAPAGLPTALLWSIDPGRYVAATPGWCVDLGLNVVDLAGQLVGVGSPDPSGTLLFHAGLPPAVAGLEIHLQATSSGPCPEPLQSAVVVRRIG